MTLRVSLGEMCQRAVAAAKVYVLDRQSPSGGFCFYRTSGLDQPNLGDTRFALGALRILGAPTPHAELTVEFLRQSRLFGLNYLYAYALALEYIGMSSHLSADRRDQISALTVTLPGPLYQVETSKWLERARKTIRLQLRHPGSTGGSVDQLDLASSSRRSLNPDRTTRYSHVARFIENLQKNGGFGDSPNLWDTYLALSVWSQLGVTAVPENIAFVDSLQQRPFGFKMSHASSMGSLDVLYAGVRCCQLLHLRVRYEDEILKFVLACQLASGGFARAPVALANLEYTYRALAIVAALAPAVIPPMKESRKRVT